MTDVGIVIIGRDEGEQLLPAFRSARDSGACVVYVDSASTDNSVELARHEGLETVVLSTEVPLSAARGRNAGFQYLSTHYPALHFIQFVDGDCELDTDWLATAQRELERDETLALVCGQLRERHPDKSIYGLLCDMEWRKPGGEITYSGGIFMIRAAVFAQMKGVDPSGPAGEEPELCNRIRAAGHRIVRVDAPMAIHNANMIRFGQWWTRNYRTGYGGLDIQSRFGQLGFSKINRSAWIWVVGWPATVVAAALAGFVVGGATTAMVCGGVAAAILPAQIARLAAKTKTPELSWPQAITCASMTLLSKVAQIQGQVSWYLHHAMRRDSEALTTKSA